MRNKILSLLVLLLTAASGAWADETNVYNSGQVDLHTLKVGDILMSGVTLNCNTESWDNLELDVNRYAWDGSTQTTTPQSVEAPTIGENGQITYHDMTFTPVTEGGEAGGAWIVLSIEDLTYSTHNYKKVHVGGIEAPLTVEWNASTKTGTFSMPGSDVVLTPQYAPAAKWDVENAGTTEEKVLLPAALEGIIAGQDAAIVTAGQSAQGTVMYAVTTTAEAAPALTAFSATVPTAKTYDDATTLYVWYYIKGHDTPDGQQATEENTFNDSEISATPLKVDILTNKFDLTLSPAPVKNMTVTVAGQAATPDQEGKVEAVKMESEVKLKANTGYKLRKVVVKNNEKKLTIGDITLDITGCTTWQQVADKNSTLISISNNMVWNASTSKNLKKGDSYVRPDDPVDPTATDYQFVLSHS